MDIKLVVSLTTTPKRLPLIMETLESIINQLHFSFVHKIYVHIPDICKRTNEIYPDPKELFDNKYEDIIVWNKCGEDLGPITKLQGILNILPEEEDVWIITIDDDIKYLQYLIELYILFLNRIVPKENKNIAFGISGFTYTNEPSKGYSFNAIYDAVKQTDILEGYASICYHRSYFKKSWKNYLDKCLDNKYCKFSDDLIISNWLSLHKIQLLVIGSPWVCRKTLWGAKCMLPHGDEEDALHKGGLLEDNLSNNYERYIQSMKYLKKIKLLSKNLDK